MAVWEPPKVLFLHIQHKTNCCVQRLVEIILFSPLLSAVNSLSCALAALCVI